jgi:hypothetical protein
MYILDYQLNEAMGADLPRWISSRDALKQKLSDFNGFIPNHTHHLYVLEFSRDGYEEPYFYVGNTNSGDDGLFQEIRRRGRNPFSIQRPVEYEGVDVLTTHRKDEYTVVDIERIETLIDPPDAMGKEYSNNGERRLAYEVAIEYNTTKVLGGK